MSGDAEPERRVEVVARERAYDGFFKLDVLRVRHSLFRGGSSEVLKRELFVQREAVAVLPYDPVRDVVVLVEQFRAGAVDSPDGAWLLEGVAGLLDAGERPEETAAREVREECGLEVGRLERVCVYTSSPGASTERVTAFVGEVAAPPDAGGVFGQPGEHEDIRASVVPFDEAAAMFRAGRITAANTVVPLQHLMLHRPRLRAAWAGLEGAAAPG